MLSFLTTQETSKECIKRKTWKETTSRVWIHYTSKVRTNSYTIYWYSESWKLAHEYINYEVYINMPTHEDRKWQSLGQNIEKWYFITMKPKTCYYLQNSPSTQSFNGTSNIWYPIRINQPLDSLDFKALSDSLWIYLYLSLCVLNLFAQNVYAILQRGSGRSS